MNRFNNYNIYKNYINTLLKNQNDTNIYWFQDIYTKSNYQKLLKNVLKVIKEHPNASLTTLRFLLFSQSGLKEMIDSFVHETQITPGLVIDFGTEKNRDTILCGLAQECTFKDGIFLKAPQAIEENTIFDLASTSKLFTAISILKLEEEGLIDLYEPITKYVKEFKNLSSVTVYDLLKFRIKIVTNKRIDNAKAKEEAEDILFSVHPHADQVFTDAYTDMGAMVLKYVVEAVSKMPFTEFVSEAITKYLKMDDTYLNVPKNKLYRVANENYSTIIDKNGNPLTRYDNYLGTVHDPKASIMGHSIGNAPGHAGYFSTKDDLIKLGNALINGTILPLESVLSMSDTATGFYDNIEFSKFYGSMVYLKQPDPKNLSAYPPLSGKAFMSPGFAGTTLVVDPLNKITLFIGSPRLHNRIYRIDPTQWKNIKIDELGKKTFKLPNGEEKIVCSDFTARKEKIVTLALDLALQYQLLEKLKPESNGLHLVRELN